MPEGISRFVKPRPGHPPSDAYNVAFAAKNGAEVVQGGETKKERERKERIRTKKAIFILPEREKEKERRIFSVVRSRDEDEDDEGVAGRWGRLEATPPRARRAENSWSYLAVF